MQKYCGKTLRRLASFDWRIYNGAIGGGVQQALAAAQNKEAYTIKEIYIDEKHEVEQCKQNEIEDVLSNKNGGLPTFADNLEDHDPSNVTLGESNYNTKRIRKSGSIHSLFQRLRAPSTNLVLKDLKDIELETNSVRMSTLQLPKSNLLLPDIDSNTNSALNSATNSMCQLQKSNMFE